MSYLDLPRIHFSGNFFANPSTVNNKLANYNPDVKLIPVGSPPFGVKSDLSDYAGFQYINPTGLGYFFFKNCRVLDGMDAQGMWLSESGGANVLGAKLEVYDAYARIVDMDADQQSISQVYGLKLRLTFPDGCGFYGPLETSALADLWYGRVPSLIGDSAASGVFKTIIPRNKLSWFGKEPSAWVKSLKERATGGISIKWMTDAYHGDRDSPWFNNGRVVGSIGPAFEGEAIRFAGDRRLISANSLFGKGFWKIDDQRNTAIIDLSNCLPLQLPAGETLPLGHLQPVIIDGEHIRPIPYFIDPSKAWLECRGGIHEVSLSDEQAGLLKTCPLGIASRNPDGSFRLAMKEHESLTWINFDQSWLRLIPGQQAKIKVVARTGNQPLANQSIAFQLAEAQVNNKPSSGLHFSRDVMTDKDGIAYLEVRAQTPTPLPPRRAVIDSQLYYVGGPWQQYGDLMNQSGNGALTVLVFNAFQMPSAINWKDHIEPLLNMYAHLYPGFTQIMDLSDYETFKKHASKIRRWLNLPVEHPEHFPVSRDLAPSKAAMITRWIDEGLLYRHPKPLTAIETERLELRCYRQGDEKTLLKQLKANSSRLEEVLAPPVKELRNEQQTKDLIRSLEEDWDGCKQFIISIWQRKEHALVGECYVGALEWAKGHAEIGYFAFREFEGKGLMYEAASALIEHLFAEVGLRRLVLRCDSDNKRSIALAERCGFVSVEGQSHNVRSTKSGHEVPVLTFFLEKPKT